ncbi:porin [Pseudoduganella lutea]|uniref:Porin n=1 Tax=Pseudoduganella lutea TaxID=321985 RepID=A0A4P6KV12_9BURK|nr:porin [Pseudoduganella lutea]QBE62951.1 porin [Pseudoduganella lutea]
MKKTLISVAVLGAMSSAAFAQSNVTIYGIVDAGIVAERGGKDGNVTKVSSGVANASRIGFRGTEDLGGGLSAIFTLETGYKTDDGQLDNTSNTLFNRQAFVGLRSKEAGTLTVGRQYTPWYNALVQVGDPFAAGLSGSAKNLFPASGINVRNSNAVVYQTPVFNGFSGEVFYGFGEQSESSAGRQLSAAVSYTNGPLNARVAYNNRNNDTASTATTVAVERGIGHNSLLAVNYDFQVAKAYFMFNRSKGLNSIAYPNQGTVGGVTGGIAYTTVAVPASRDSRDGLLGVQVPVAGAGKVIASFIYKDDREAVNRDAKQWAIGYMHDISKRTTGYVSYAKIDNKNGAAFTVGGNTEVGSGDSAFNVGVRHSF